MIAGILFDLDNTLFDRDSAAQDLFAHQHQVFRNSLGAVSREAYVERLLELDEHGYTDKQSMYGALAHELGLDASLSETLAQHFRASFPDFCRPFPDVIPTLTELRGRGLKLGLITNGTVRVQASKIERMGLAPLFSTTLISEREGVRKPDREIFERALQRLGISAREAWHVGDHPIADIAGAHNAELTAVWRYVPYWTEPTEQSHTIVDLAELIGLLDD